MSTKRSLELDSGRSKRAVTNCSSINNQDLISDSHDDWAQLVGELQNLDRDHVDPYETLSEIFERVTDGNLIGYFIPYVLGATDRWNPTRTAMLAATHQQWDLLCPLISHCTDVQGLLIKVLEHLDLTHPDQMNELLDYLIPRVPIESLAGTELSTMVYRILSTNNYRGFNYLLPIITKMDLTIGLFLALEGEGSLIDLCYLSVTDQDLDQFINLIGSDDRVSRIVTEAVESVSFLAKLLSSRFRVILVHLSWLIGQIFNSSEAHAVLLINDGGLLNLEQLLPFLDHIGSNYDNCQFNYIMAFIKPEILIATYPSVKDLIPQARLIWWEAHLSHAPELITECPWVPEALINLALVNQDSVLRLDDGTTEIRNLAHTTSVPEIYPRSITVHAVTGQLVVEYYSDSTRVLLEPGMEITIERYTIFRISGSGKLYVT